MFFEDQRFFCELLFELGREVGVFFFVGVVGRCGC